MSGVLVLSEGNAQGWAARALAEHGPARICATLGDLLRLVALERPAVAVVELPVAGLGDTQTVEVMMGNPVCRAMRWVVIGGSREGIALAQQTYPELRYLSDRASDEEICDAIGCEAGPVTTATWELSRAKVTLRGLSDRTPSTRTAVLIAWMTALYRVPGELGDRLDTLRYLAPRVRTIVHGAPQPLYPERQTGERAQTVIGRLANAWGRLLDDVLLEVDRAGISPSQRHTSRCWLINQHVRILEVLIHNHVVCGAALPGKTWMRLYDQQVYVHGRLLAEQRSTGDARTGTLLWDVRHSYVRSLLWGCCGARLAPAAVQSSRVVQDIAPWARRTALREPRSQDWHLGKWVVDVHGDRGPRFLRSRQESINKCYVVVPPKEFIERIEARPLAGLEIAGAGERLNRRERRA